MNKCINIDGRDIGSHTSPFVVAEMSANHNGDLNTALRIINEAKSAGADAVKIQTYRPDTITLDSQLSDFKITDGLWAGRTLYELYEWAQTPWEWHKPIFEHAKKIGITVFSTPFDRSSVDFLEALDVPAYKIASFEVIDLQLIEYVASMRKPMIISTGMADSSEIQWAIDAARHGGCKDLALLHCVSGYPAPEEDYNLLTIPDMINRFGLVTGLSDHTLDNTTAIASVPLGAAIIEKHFTLDRKGGGADDSFSLEPREMLSLCRSVKAAWRALGKIDYGLKASEKSNMKFRRSLYFVKDKEAGDIVSEECIRSIRPGFGLPPRYYRELIGKRLKVAIKRGTPTSFELFDE